ncbi:uncharacterized protein BDV17DRAFT_294917 [Aspergillus undulatus]|uniref:uncharacterized protein n=1 Tax=Aspergillus undulatus TaxID=1810928 RepID=UPI003CCE2349
MAYNHLLADGSPITESHVQAQYFLPIIDRILEPQTVVHFNEFTFWQKLPDGTRPSEFGKLLEEEVPFFYGSESDDTTMGKIMVTIGSDKDSSRLTMVGKNIHSLKSRLWEGVTPMSDQRWEEEGLHLEENFDQACQHLSAVVAVFEYLNGREVQESLRETFNLIYAHWEELDRQINAQRAKNGTDPISLASLWTAYMASHYKVMTNRAHQWVTRHVDALRAPILEDLLTYEPVIEWAYPDAEQWRLTNALHMLLEISIRADYTIMMPMEGYKEYTPPDRTETDPYRLYSANVTERGKAYSQRVKSYSHQISFQNIFKDIGQEHKTSEKTSRESYHESAMEQIEAQIKVRKELRGDDWDSEIQEPWITRLLSSMDNEEDENMPKDSGLVIYRLTYAQSEPEWGGFVRKLEEHMSDWGDGQTGSDAIKPFLKLHWIDGQELGLVEDDIEAAKEHFNKNFNPDDEEENDENEAIDTSKSKSDLPMDLQKNAFLVIDSASFNSYTDTNTKKRIETPNTANKTETTVNQETKNEHDHDHSRARTRHPFLLAIDPNYSAQEGPSRPDESPGYTGAMRITGSLIWGDLYALLETQSARLEELWPLAIYHPEQVYVGPVIPLQLCTWDAEQPIPWWIFKALAWELVAAILGSRGVLVLLVFGGGGYWFVWRRRRR